MNRRTIHGLVTSIKSDVIIGNSLVSGYNQNYNTSGSYHRSTGNWLSTIDLLIYDNDAFVWDVRNAGIYTLRFVTSQTGTTPLYIITTSQVVSAAGSITFIPDDGVMPFVLRSGKNYYLQLYKTDAPEVTWWSYSSQNYINNYIYHGQINYDGTYYTGSIPCKLKARPLSNNYELRII